MSETTTERPSSWLARMLARLVTRHPRWILVFGFAIALSGGVLASRLRLGTDLAELLPPKAPSVVSLKALNQRVGGTGGVAIAMEGNVEAFRRYIPRLVTALREGLGKDLLSIRYQRKEVYDYFKRFAAYYVSVEDLESWTDRVADITARTVNPALIDLDDAAAGKSKEEEIRELVDEVRQKRDQKMKQQKYDDPETGIFLAEEGRLTVLFVRPAANTLNLAASEGVLQKIRDIIAQTQPEKEGVRLAGFTGSIPSAIAEVRAIQRDIVSTALLVILLVTAVVALYFHSVREMLLLSGALIVGAAVSMGFAELWIGHVNAQTAFLGAIIVGTGINYGIIFLDRYRRLRAAVPAAELTERTRESLTTLIEKSCDQTLRATWVAALGTAVSFGVLAAGEVESFHQFGWIGGLGIIACWLASFTLVPATVFLADSRPRSLRLERRRAAPGLPAITRFFFRLGEGCQRSPWLIVGISLGLMVVSGALVWRVRHHLLETDMSRLSTKSSKQSGIAKLDDRLRVMDDRSSTPAVIATGNLEESGGVCEVLNRRMKSDLKGMMQRCYSMNDILPTQVGRHRELMARLDRQLDRIAEEDLKPEERKDFAELRRMLRQAPPQISDLPPSMREPFIERDGSIGKLAYVDPRNEHVEEVLYKFSDAIREIHLPSGQIIESSGESVVFADVLRAVRRDTKKLTFWGALLVMVVLALITRRLSTFVRVASAVLAGVVMMCGWAALMGEKLNFFNFVALPTTFGIGIDYAINVEERLRTRGRQSLAAIMSEIGPPVALASLTTILGYLSLIIADSQALVSFGRLAILGEITCTFSAFLLLPALWVIYERRKRAPGAVVGTQESPARAASE